MLLIPLVKKQIKHYQAEWGDTQKMFPLICTRYMQISLFKQDIHYVTLVEITDLSFHRSQKHLIDVHLRVRVSWGPTCHLSLNAYVHPLNEDSIGQLIEQYPGMARERRRRNSAQWCHLVLGEDQPTHPLSTPTSTMSTTVRALPCWC